MTRALARPRPPSFWDGLLALPRGVRFIWQRPRCWPAAAVPCLVLLVLGGWLLWESIRVYGPELAAALFPHADTWYEAGARAVVRWVVSLLAAYLGGWVALLLAPALSGPALERLVRAQEQALGAAPRSSASFWLELRCGVEAQLWGLLLALPLWLGVWLAAVFLPGAALLVPLQILPPAFGLTWSLLDYPLSSRGVRVRARWAQLRRAPGAIAGFGLCLAALSLIPGAAFLLLPGGVVGATRLTWGLAAETEQPGDAPG